MRVAVCFFFFNDTATTEIYTLSLHDALPICRQGGVDRLGDLVKDVLTSHLFVGCGHVVHADGAGDVGPDRKSTRLNSSHANISYAVFCLKKKKKIKKPHMPTWTTIMYTTS